MLFYILLWLAVATAAVLLYCRQVNAKFAKHGVKHFKPLPLLGNMGPQMLQKEHFVKSMEILYLKFPNERFVGRFEFMSPMVVIRDIELLKRVTVKDFEYFLDHRSLITAENDPLFGRNLFSLKGQEWKDMRSTLSPAFTSSKIRVMMPFIVEVGDHMIASLKKKIENAEEDYIDIDSKDLSTRNAIDIIASCSFGMKVDSHVDLHNEFYTTGEEASNFGLFQLFLLFVMMTFPKVMYKLNIKFVPEKVTCFFKSLLSYTMQERETRNILRPDIIHLLMKAKKAKLVHDEKSTKDPDAGFATVEESVEGKKNINRAWTDIDLVAQAFVFFVAGFETVSSAMTFAIHELAVNPDIQDRLVAEIKEHHADNGGKFDVNSIQNMKYMDMVVSEVLRL